MFGDFITLCVDQVVNHATKYHWMFNEQVNIPVVIRTPMGGGRGYGPTHSQSLESLFMSVPGLQIVTPSILHDPGAMLKKCVLDHQHPVLFVEHKSSYPKELIDGDMSEELHVTRVQNSDGFDDVVLSMYPDERADVLLVTYGGMSELSMKLAIDLFMEEEILVEIVVCSQLRSLNRELLMAETEKVGRVLVLEEGHMIGGWGAEVSSCIHEEAFDALRAPVARVGAKDIPIPSAMPLEELVLPSGDEVKNKIVALMAY